MITGNIKELKDIALYPKLIQKALMYLKETDFTSMNPGIYEIQGKDLFAEVQELRTNYKENRNAETHKTYVDVQFLVDGEEKIGCSLLSDSSEILEDLRPEKDLIYYKQAENETMLNMKRGDFAIFFPTDIHRPGCEKNGPQKIKKVVMKIRYSNI